MDNAVVLFENPRIRLGGAALNAGEHIHHAAARAVGGGIEWRAEAGQVSLRGKCEEQEPELWHISFELTNSGADAEVGVMLPYAFYHIEQERPLRFFDPTFGGVLKTAAVPIGRTYPGPASFCLTAAVGEKAAIATGLLDGEQRRVMIRHTPSVHYGQIRFALERVLVKSGQTVALPMQYIKAAPTWAEAFEPYKTWFNEMFPRVAPRSEWLASGKYIETRLAHCLVPFEPFKAPSGVLIFDNEGPARSIETIKAEIDQAFERGAKEGYTPLFYQYGWWEAMASFKGLFAFDSHCGDYTKRHDYAKKSVEYIHQKGGKVYLYTNFISIGDESEIYREHPDLLARDKAGFPQYNAGYPMLMLCPGAPGIRDYWRRVVDCILTEIGADGIFLDQVCGGHSPQYCYCEAHHHAHPDTYGVDAIELVKHILDYAKSVKPDCYVGGELMLDSRSVLLDETHGYGYSGPPDYAAAVERGEPMPEYYVFAKYLCPGLYSSNGSVMDGASGRGGQEIWRDYRPCFEAGVTPCATDTPDAIAYLYGPANGKSVLAARSAKAGVVKVTLPDGSKVAVETLGLEPVYQIVE